jgi:hypothetical protein
MQEILNELCRLLGSHSAVAERLQYSDRQYLNIRQKVAQHKPLKPRIELWILANYSLLKKD